MRKSLKKQKAEFLKILPQLEPLEVIAVAKILNIAITKDKSAETIIMEILEKFENADYKRRTELLEMLNAAVSSEKDGDDLEK